MKRKYRNKATGATFTTNVVCYGDNWELVSGDETPAPATEPDAEPVAAEAETEAPKEKKARK